MNYKQLLLLLSAWIFAVPCEQRSLSLEDSEQLDIRENTNHTEPFCFPDGFLFGSATAAYQVEGGWNLTGRELSIWDVYCREHDNLACANVAVDEIHRYASDIELMGELGFQAYRFSISWSRVMSWSDEDQRMLPNPQGIAYYKAVFAELKKTGIRPLVTMYHWDLPQALVEHLDPPGWLNPGIVQHFTEYSTLLWANFGLDADMWATFNEPLTFIQGGYSNGRAAPGVDTFAPPAGLGVPADEITYRAAHNVLRAHAYAVRAFRTLRDRGKLGPQAKVSIVLCTDMALGVDPTSAADEAAAERYLEFMLGWFLSPVVNGTYPEAMVRGAGARLPVFSPQEQQLLRGSLDLVMLNHYATNSITACDSPRSKTACSMLHPGWEADHGLDTSQYPPSARLSSTTNGKHNCAWFYAYPEGYGALLQWTNQRSGGRDIYLTENGWCGNNTVDNQDQVWYYDAYLRQVAAQIKLGVPIVGYTAWSLLDNYEWGSFNPRFGLFHIDYPPEAGSHAGYTPKPSDLKRTPRPAAHYISQIAKTKCLPPSTAPFSGSAGLDRSRSQRAVIV